jgi:hypothetical protein
VLFFVGIYDKAALGFGFAFPENNRKYAKSDALVGGKRGVS